MVNVNGPIFVLSTPRSGSTLVSHLIGTHPSVLTIGETNFVNVLMAIKSSSSKVEGYWDSISSPPNGEDGDHHQNKDRFPTVEVCRSLGAKFFSSLVTNPATQTICDKSLTNIDGADLLLEVWPDAKFIILYRHCADFMDSALRAMPWGLNGYKLADYAVGSSTNTILALTRFWLDTAKRLGSFETRSRSNSLVVRYEDLVFDTQGTLQRIWPFLEISPPEDTSRAFGIETRGLSPGDHKFRHTEEIRGSSVGRGLRLPIYQLLPDLILSALNVELTRIGYVQVDEKWGCFDRSMDVGSRQAMVAGQASDSRSSTRGWGGDRSSEMSASGGADQKDHTEEGGLEASDSDEPDWVNIVIIEDATLLWRGEFWWPSGKPHEDSEGKFGNLGTLVVGLDALLALAVGYVEYGDAFRHGDFRFYSRGPNGTIRRAEEEELSSEVGRFINTAAQSLLAKVKFDPAISELGAKKVNFDFAWAAQ